VRLQHRAVAIDHLVQILDRRIGARGPGDLVVPEAVHPDRIDLDHAQLLGLVAGAFGWPERTAQAKPRQDEGARRCGIVR
jgi:hypothetical protein